jgi:pimeloyl-ACP methyl ester carboxylesterase
MSVSRAAGFTMPALLLFLLLSLLLPSHAAETASKPPDKQGKPPSVLDGAVKKIAGQRITVNAPQGAGLLPLYADHKIDAPAPDVKRVLIVVHGALRNADAYFAAGRQAVDAAGAAGAGTLLIAPQFLTPADLKAFKLATETLAWSQEGWKDGEAARSPAPISSFSAMDALLEHFTNRALYPALTEVVVAGHSAGAQIVQRYAVAGQADAVLRQAGIAVRYVVANPSTYLYFDNSRPGSDGAFRAADTGSCPKVNQWKYGMGAIPAYLAEQDVAGIEARYAARKVVYLLGTADTDPHTHFIDRSCAAMAQGPYRLARGLAYFRYLQGRHASGLQQSVVEVPGVGHDDKAMFTSSCGLAVLFGSQLPASCPHIP